MKYRDDEIEQLKRAIEQLKTITDVFVCCNCGEYKPNNVEGFYGFNNKAYFPCDWCKNKVCSDCYLMMQQRKVNDDAPNPFFCSNCHKKYNEYKEKNQVIYGFSTKYKMIHIECAGGYQL